MGGSSSDDAMAPADVTVAALAGLSILWWVLHLVLAGGEADMEVMVAWMGMALAVLVLLATTVAAAAGKTSAWSIAGLLSVCIALLSAYLGRLFADIADLCRPLIDTGAQHALGGVVFFSTSITAGAAIILGTLAVVRSRDVQGTWPLLLGLMMLFHALWFQMFRCIGV